MNPENLLAMEATAKRLAESSIKRRNEAIARGDHAAGAHWDEVAAGYFGISAAYGELHALAARPCYDHALAPQGVI